MVRRLSLALAVSFAACAGPAPDPGTASKECAPAGWTVGNFPPGSRDFGFGPGIEIGRIRLLLPETVANGRGLSKSGTAAFITDWWTVTEHGETQITFADGRTGTQYRKRAGSAITTEFTTAAGTWQLYASESDERYYDEVLRCVEARLVGTAR